METKERRKLSSEERAARQADRARKRDESPIQETPAPRVAALDTTPERQQQVIVQDDSGALAPASAIATQQRMQALEDQIQQQQRLINLMMAQKREEKTNVPPTPGFKTPRQPKEKDTEYAKLVAMTAQKNAEPSATPTMENFLDALTKTLSNATTKSSISEPPKWDGKDAGYNKWWRAFRAYAKDKKWLSTLEDPLGPGTTDHPNPTFDHEINTAIYNKLQHLTRDGKASTWISRAPEFNGWAAAQELTQRYGGHTRQEISTLKSTIRKIKHTKGTSMPNHIDDMDALFQNLEDCGYSADDEEKSQWLMDSISESTYDHVKAYAEGQRYDNAMTYTKLVNMYNNTCFSKYPQFQVESVLGTKYSQHSSNTKKKWCSFHQSDKHDESECKALHGNNKNNGKGNGKGKGKGKGKTNGKGKGKGRGNGKGKGKGRGQGNNRRHHGRGNGSSNGKSCHYCGSHDHLVADCPLEQQHWKDVNEAQTQAASQNPQRIHEAKEPTKIDFSNFVLHLRTRWGTPTDGIVPQARTVWPTPPPNFYSCLDNDNACETEETTETTETITLTTHNCLLSPPLRLYPPSDLTSHNCHHEETQPTSISAPILTRHTDFASAAVQNAQTSPPPQPKVEDDPDEHYNSDNHDIWHQAVLNTPHLNNSLRLYEPLSCIFDTGASISMLPQGTGFTDLRRFSHDVSGCFGDTRTNLHIGTFHGIITLDCGERIHAVLPNTLAIPEPSSGSHLIGAMQTLLADHVFTPDIHKPTLHLSGGGCYTFDIENAHLILRMHPVDPTDSNLSPFRTVYLHQHGPYDPPTISNRQDPITNQNPITLRRPNLCTPSALRWHLRFACANYRMLKTIHSNVHGMTIQKDSWKTLNNILPCEACIAGKLRKSHHTRPTEFFPMTNLNNDIKETIKSEPNELVAVDWGIVKQADRFKNTVFALYLDKAIGLVFIHPAPSRGCAGDTLQAYIQQWGTPKRILSENAKEFLEGDFKTLCVQHNIRQEFSPPYSPNFNPAERYMDILTSGARSMLYLSGLDPNQFWTDALLHRATLQLYMPLQNNKTPFELATGKTPNVHNLKIFGSEAMSHVEKSQRLKFDPKTEQCIYLGTSSLHNHDTFKLYNLRTGKVMYRRNVAFNERSFPARTNDAIKRSIGQPDVAETGEDLINKSFIDDNETFHITGVGNEQGQRVVYYQNEQGKEFFSTTAEVRQWVASQHPTSQMTTHLYTNTNTHIEDKTKPLRDKTVTQLAFETYQQLAAKPRKNKHGIEIPRSFNDALQTGDERWFRAINKERGGILQFKTWEHIDQTKVTQEMRKRALRAHHIFDVKRSGQVKNRVVVNGRRQDSSTYSDTASPVASLLQVRIFLAIIAAREYYVMQGDYKNAYLTADLQDFVLIVIPDGFPHAGDIAILRKAQYGTKQGARRFYDKAADDLKSIGMIQCPTEPCLFRYTTPTSVCFLLLYVDDSLIGGDKEAVEFIMQQLQQKYECNFHPPHDFLGMDIEQSPNKQTISLSMKSFTKKMIEKFQIPMGSHPLLTPGRTDIKISRDDVRPKEEDDQFRSKVGSLSWLTLGLRYDLAYSTKELSRVLDQPTIKAQDTLLPRALQYAAQTADYKLTYHGPTMTSYNPPSTRKKPTDTINPYQDITEANLDDPIPMPDDKERTRDYIYKGKQLEITIQSDIDLGGVTETRQSTSGYLVYLGGALIHWKCSTEKLVLTSTMAGEYVALSKADAAGKFIKTIMEFYGQTTQNYKLFTDSQAAEYLATQPNFTSASRSIDLRFHSVKQSYLEGDCRIGGVSSKDNEADILTKSLQPPLHDKHCHHLKSSNKHPLTETNDGAISATFLQCPTSLKRRRDTPTDSNNEDENQHSIPTLIPLSPEQTNTSQTTTITQEPRRHLPRSPPAAQTTERDDITPSSIHLSTNNENTNDTDDDSETSGNIALTVILNNPPEYGEGAAERRERFESIRQQIATRIAARDQRRALSNSTTNSLRNDEPSNTSSSINSNPPTSTIPMGWGNQTWTTDDVPLDDTSWRQQHKRQKAQQKSHNSPTQWPPPHWGPPQVNTWPTTPHAPLNPPRTHPEETQTQVPATETTTDTTTTPSTTMTHRQTAKKDKNKKFKQNTLRIHKSTSYTLITMADTNQLDHDRSRPHAQTQLLSTTNIHHHLFPTPESDPIWTLIKKEPIFTPLKIEKKHPLDHYQLPPAPALPPDPPSGPPPSHQPRRNRPDRPLPLTAPPRKKVRESIEQEIKITGKSSWEPITFKCTLNDFGTVQDLHICTKGELKIESSTSVQRRDIPSDSTINSNS